GAQHALPGVRADAGSVVEDAGDRGLADARLASDVHETGARCGHGRGHAARLTIEIGWLQVLRKLAGSTFQTTRRFANVPTRSTAVQPRLAATQRMSLPRYIPRPSGVLDAYPYSGCGRRGRGRPARLRLQQRNRNAPGFRVPRWHPRHL